MSKLDRVSPRDYRLRSPCLRKLGFENLEDRRLLAVVTVDTNQDVVDFTDGVTSLREAIFATNLVGGADEIVFDFGHDGPETIVLTQGELAISDSLTITGPGAALLSIDASGNDPTPDENNGDGGRVFNIDNGDNSTNINVEIHGLTLTGGDVSGDGGAILSRELLSITDSTVAWNSTGSSGGGIHSSVRTTITGSTISGNSAGSDGGGIWVSSINTTTITDSSINGNSARSGGGIWVSHALVVNDSTTSGNSAQFDGGGIYVRFGSTRITDSTISGNSAGFDGGGIWSRSNTTTIFDSTISNNSTSSNGGGIWASNTTAIRDSTISGNLAGNNGGGVHVSDGRKTIYGSTISDNSAGNDGGGMWLRDTITISKVSRIIHSTVSGNSADNNGGGIWLDVGTGPHPGNSIISHSTIVGNMSDAESSGVGMGGGVFLRRDAPRVDHVIVAGNYANSGSAPDITRILNFFNLSSSLIGNNRGSGLIEAPVGSPDANGNLIGGTIHGVIDPLLGELGDNGGPTLTHALLPGSPAINAGDLNAVAGVGVPEFDQRGDGFDRVFSSRIDIGAYELQEFSDLNLLVDTLEDESDGDFTRFDLSLREAIELANANPVPDTIRFDPSLAGGTILLTMGELAITDSVEIVGLGADLLTIDASGNDPTPSVRRGDGTSVFYINDHSSTNADVTISGLTITGGDTHIGGGGIRVTENLTLIESVVTGNDALPFHSPFRRSGGGGILSRPSPGGELTVLRSKIIDNVGSGFGGGVNIYNYGINATFVDSVISGNTAASVGGGISTLSYRISSLGKTVLLRTTISNNRSGFDGGGVRILRGNLSVLESTITGNTSGHEGGGVGVYYADEVLIKNSVISGNSSGAHGGGVFLDRSGRFPGAGVFLIENSTLSNNRAAQGGGLAITRQVRRNEDVGAQVDIVGTTISGNESYGDGGGIWVDGFVTISHTTVTNNTSDINHLNGGSGGGVFVSAGTLFLNHSILAGNHDNTGAAHDVAGIINSSFSLIGFGAEFLGPLANNGGPTLTHALLSGSPAIDAGDPTLVEGVGVTPMHDQRGFPFRRISGGRIDIGAFESQPLPGDFDLDGDADSHDLAIWEASYGIDSGADANGDGYTSGIDFLAWQITQGWNIPAPLQVGKSAIAIASDVPIRIQFEPRLADVAMAVELATNKSAAISFGKFTAGNLAIDFERVLQGAEDYPRIAVKPASGAIAEHAFNLFDVDPSFDEPEENSPAELALDEVFALI